MNLSELTQAVRADSAAAASAGLRPASLSDAEAAARVLLVLVDLQPTALDLADLSETVSDDVRDAVFATRHQSLSDLLSAV